jgi:hypothetical protein
MLVVPRWTLRDGASRLLRVRLPLLFVIPETAKRLSGIQIGMRVFLDSGFAAMQVGCSRLAVIITKSGKPDFVAPRNDVVAGLQTCVFVLAIAYSAPRFRQLPNLRE